MEKDYKVFEGNMEYLDKQIEKINKRARKNNLKEISYVINKEYFEDILEGKGEKEEIVKYFDITLQADEVKIEGYLILASLNHTYAGSGNIIKTLSDKEIPVTYKTIDGNCDHCGTNRRRKETVLLEDENGKIIQVGKSCLKDFLGMDINDKMMYMEFLHMFEYDENSLDEINPKNADSYKFEKYINTIGLLNIANEVIKHFGYVKTVDEFERESTKAKSLKLYNQMDCNRWISEEIDIHNKVSVKGYEDIEVLEALQWIQAQENNNSYINNLQILCKSEYVNYRETGILCSLMTCYYKSKERENNKAVKEESEKKIKEAINNEYFGNVGDKIQLDVIYYLIYKLIFYALF